jgi:luciferase-like monooxygenase
MNTRVKAAIAIPQTSLHGPLSITYAAAVTTRMPLGAAVLLTVLHSPVHMAKRLATLDELSGGPAHHRSDAKLPPEGHDHQQT